MFKFKKVVDERQELELLKIEHFGFWFLFCMLLTSIIVQSTFMNAPFKQYAAEFFIFMAGCIVFLIGCIKRGQWDYYTKPTMKTYLITSLIGSFGFSMVMGIAKYNSYEILRNNILTMLLPLIMIMMFFMFILIFVTCLIIGKLVIRKQQQLEKEFSDDK